MICFAMLSLQNRGKDTKKILYTQGSGSAYVNFIQNVSIFTHQKKGRKEILYR